MKYLFAIKNLSHTGGGAEKVFCTICSELAELGHQVTIITFDHPSLKSFYPYSKKINRISLGIGVPGERSRLFDAKNKLLKLRHAIQNNNPDVIVGFMHSMFVPLAVAALGTGIPVIGSEHITVDHYKTRPFQFLLLNLTAPLLKKVTVLSESIRDKYPYLVRKRMIPITNPIEHPKSISKFIINKEFYTLLNVGRLNEEKNQVVLIRAFREISDDFPKWNLRIVGEGNLREYLEIEIDKLELTNRVSMPGVIKDVSREYLAADIFVMSSSNESFGLVTAEAMSYGLPVIGFSDCPGTKELIQDGVNGFLVANDGVRHIQLAEQLKILMNDHLLRTRFGGNSANVIGARLGCDHVVSQWDDLLKSVVR